MPRFTVMGTILVSKESYFKKNQQIVTIERNIFKINKIVSWKISVLLTEKKGGNSKFIKTCLKPKIDKIRNDSSLGQNEKESLISQLENECLQNKRQKRS